MSSFISEQKNFQEQLVGSEVPLERVCEDQLLLLWKLMQQHFNILHEELEYLIVEIMERFVQVSASKKKAQCYCL